MFTSRVTLFCAALNLLVAVFVAFQTTVPGILAAGIGVSAALAYFFQWLIMRGDER